MPMADAPEGLPSGNIELSGYRVFMSSETFWFCPTWNWYWSYVH